MSRKIALAVLAIAVMVPSGAGAAVDMNGDCASQSRTSVIQGDVADALGQPVQDLTVEVFATNSQAPPDASILPDKTDSNGFYQICALHNTYDVHVRDKRGFAAFADVNRPYTTFTNLQDVDFTPQSGFPVLYRLNMTVTPVGASSTKLFPADRTITFTVRTKMRYATDLDDPDPTRKMRLTLPHILSPSPQTVDMDEAASEGGGAGNGGWNVWTKAVVIPLNYQDNAFQASVTGFEAGTAITQTARDYYYVDNFGPVFGPATSTMCGGNLSIDDFKPDQNFGTTNPQPYVRQGVCDRSTAGTSAQSNGSGLTQSSVLGGLCPDTTTPLSSCTPITPQLGSFVISWTPASPLAVGTYYIRWSISDRVGNVTETPTANKLKIVSCTGGPPNCGTPPRFIGPSPGNLGSGSTLGVIIGCTCTSAASIPQITVKVTDDDGAYDIQDGTLRVRIYRDEQLAPIYDYDSSKPNGSTQVNAGAFDVITTVDKFFRATGFRLADQASGRYIVTASVSDHGGNSAVLTWHFVLLKSV